MRVPISWLREFVDVPAKLTPDELHAALVRVGLEEEDFHTFELEGPIVVGQVLKFVEEPQSNGKTIRWCQVQVGADDVRGIVCGAGNFFVDDKVVVTLPGAVLPGPFPIAARKTYGHVSDGMIASARELGLGDEHDGILRLAELDLDPEVGRDAIALLGLDDWAIEVNVTPDRGYALSIRGIAREYSHSTGAAFRDPAASIPPSQHTVGDLADNPVPVFVEDHAPLRGNIGCSLFVTRVVRGVDPTRHTPAWMIARLKLAGIRSISLTVDISNYVMVELGQPLHFYDLDQLEGAITVRRAERGEKLTTLDSHERALDSEDLLITDEAGAIGMAGVMGGERTEITPNTVNVLIEAANFDPISIARSARRHKLPSEASKRFERGVDPAVAAVAATRAAELLVKLAGGTADAGIWMVGSIAQREEILLPTGYVNSIVGANFSNDETVSALEAIGATVAETADGYVVTPPSWRPDVKDQADLTEEVARILGYDRIPAVLPTAPPGRGLTRSQRYRRSVSNLLASNGLNEVMVYPFVSHEQLALFSEPGPAVELANPMDGTAPLLRTTLLPGLVTVAQRNLSRGLTDIAIFELGAVYLPSGTVGRQETLLPSGSTKPSVAVLQALNDSIPAQPLLVAALFTGDVIRKQPGMVAQPAGLSDAVTAAQQVAAAVGAAISMRATTHPGFHPGRTAALYIDETRVGVAGELLPALAHELDLPKRVAVMELNLSVLMERAPEEVSSSAIATFPAATQDLSLVVAVTVPADDVLTAVEQGAGPLLENIVLVDDYRGAGVEAGTKSLTFALRFRAHDRTLTAAEATEAKLAGVASAADKCGAVLRE